LFLRRLTKKENSFVYEVVDQIITTWEKYKVFPNKKRINETRVFDRNNDDSTNVENGWLYQRTGSDGVARNICSYGGTNFLTSFPSSTVDANGNILCNGDSVSLIKDLKIKGSASKIKAGTKVKNIRLVDGDHNIDCKIDGAGAMMLKSEFVKKI